MSEDQTTQQMSLLEDSPANHSALQENEKEQQMIAISGTKLLESLPNVNRNGLLEKMLKDLLTSTTAWYSDRCKLIWKIKVSKSNVLLFQLQASVLGIKEREFGLWATPNTMDTLPPRSKKAVIRQMTTARKGSTKPSNLREQVDTETMKMYGWMYPTPRASAAMTENMETIAKRNKYSSRLEEKIAFQMYPTPTAGCVEGGEQSSRVEMTENGGFILRKKNKPEMTFGAKLSDAMIFLEKQLYNTPTTNDAKNLTFPKESNKQNIYSGKFNSTETIKTWWQTQSEFCGVPNGVSYELDKDRSNRIKALGNSIVPQIARQIGLSIIAAEQL
jgi:hypothetical protein